MKIFIIITHKLEECQAINPAFVEPIFVIANQQNKIVIIKVSAIVQAANIPDFSTNIGQGDKAIVLYHLVDNQVSNINYPKVNISSRGHAVVEHSDRWHYEKLLKEKLNAFDTVWNHLEKKSNAEALERLKTDFLYHIYNGNTPSSFTRLAEIKDIDTYKDLYQVFENMAYDKQLDLDEDETKGAEQRKKLTLLRDALLAKK